MDKPDVDFIEGLSPAVSIDQKSTNRNPRSTVGTITEVYDYLRLLYARAGRPHCPICGAADRAADARSRSSTGCSSCEEGTRFQVLAPVVRGRKGEYVDLFRQLQTQGFSRARVDGEIASSSTEPPKLEKQEKHTIEVVVDRLAVKASRQAPAHRLGRDRARPRRRAGRPRLRRPATQGPATASAGSPSSWPAPTTTRSTIDELEPRSFSFNSPFGACPECTGLGTRMEVDPELVVPDHGPVASARARSRRGRSGARPATTSSGCSTRSATSSASRMDTPWEQLPAAAPARRPARPRTTRCTSVPQPLRPRALLLHRLRGRRARTSSAGTREAESDSSRERFEGFMREVPVPGLRGRPAQAGVARGH